jgi:hypothetical protein
MSQNYIFIECFRPKQDLAPSASQSTRIPFLLIRKLPPVVLICNQRPCLVISPIESPILAHPIRVAQWVIQQISGSGFVRNSMKSQEDCTLVKSLHR